MQHGDMNGNKFARNLGSGYVENHFYVVAYGTR